MGFFGEIIRFVRDNTIDAAKECGFDKVKEELKDAIKALKGD